MKMLTILVCDFSNSKAFADKTVEAFFIFERNFEMAIGGEAKFDKSKLKPTEMKGKEGERIKIGEIEIVYYILGFFIKNLLREIIL